MLAPPQDAPPACSTGGTYQAAGDDTTRSTQRPNGQNYVVAQIAQAMLGLLEPGIRAVACRFRGNAVELHFAVPANPDEVAEDIEDISFELDVLLKGHTSITRFVHALERFDWSDRTLLGVYEAKPSTT